MRFCSDHGNLGLAVCPCFLKKADCAECPSAAHGNGRCRCSIALQRGRNTHESSVGSSHLTAHVDTSRTLSTESLFCSLQTLPCRKMHLPLGIARSASVRLKMKCSQTVNHGAVRRSSTHYPMQMIASLANSLQHPRSVKFC